MSKPVDCEMREEGVPQAGAFWVRKNEARQELLYELTQPRTARHVRELEQPRTKHDAAELKHGTSSLWRRPGAVFIRVLLFRRRPDEYPAAHV